MAIVCWSSKLRPLLVMWTQPRMIAWLVVTVLMVLLPRLIFSGAYVVPYVIPFDPGLAFVPVSAIFFGPAGVWGSAMACVLGDLLTGTWGGLRVFRAVGWFLAAWLVSQLGRSLREKPSLGEFSSWVKFVWVTVLAAIIASAWNALGAETTRLYPFSYTFLVSILHHLVFLCGFGFLVFQFMAPGMKDRDIEWESALYFTDRVLPPFSLMFIILFGSSALLCSGAWGLALMYGYHPLHPVPVGGHLGAWMESLAIPCMVLQVVAVFWPNVRLPPESAGQLGDREYAWSSLIR